MYLNVTMPAAPLRWDSVTSVIQQLCIRNEYPNQTILSMLEILYWLIQLYYPHAYGSS